MKTSMLVAQCTSLNTLEEMGFEPGDGGWEERKNYGQFYANDLLAKLTPKQRRFAYCLNEGMKRGQVALHLMVSLQEVHQMVPRIRKRLREKGGVVWRK